MPDVIRFVLRRIALAVPLALGVATLVFVLMETAPGDPADLWLGARPVPPEVRQRIERAYGFDRPPLERYGRWLGALFLQGELGWSHSRSRPVTRALADALPPTIALAGTALVLHLAAGILFGVISAARRKRWPDHLLTLASLTLYAMPTFWLGLMAILTLSRALPLFPASSIGSVGADEWPWLERWLDRLWHLALPATVLGVASAAAMSRFIRAGLLEALAREFVRAARARGLGGSRVLLRHALRNALLPVINLVGLSLPVLISGSLVTEVVFAWPGMGRLTYDAIQAHDLPVVLASVLLATLLVVLGNLAADLALAAADPRVRLTTSRDRG
jgi:peptide/nickel transport system permease protein